MDSEKISQRNSVKLILLNERDELALMCADDKRITLANDEPQGRFWFMVGGGIEPGETLLDAAERELFEETGIGISDVEFGPEVWKCTFDLRFEGKLTTCNERFIVAKTKVTAFDMSNMTASEKSVVEEIRWFSLGDIKNSREIIHPVLLPKYLPDVIAGNYPNSPIEISLTK
ncbi:MAG: NUDIX domain-containing protein [Puniceicoccales bacterium]|jgi:8-oxo-dGTP pyrophosphatase MutT (NUDIX family)|nr:NUDIX domain-containing protein [Puniceicoccales bacterium]